jgi:outer membrane murein-binding lipoprotein Lpp
MPEFPRFLTGLLRLRPYEVELLRPARRMSPLAWMVLGTGVLALAGAVLACRPAWVHRTELASDQSRLQAAVDRLGGDTPGNGSHARSAGKSADRDSVAEAELIVAEAQRPWHELFDQLEAANKGDGASVHIVQMGVDPRFANLQLVAEGRDLGKLVRFAQTLEGGGPIRSMNLTHHEWRDALGAHVVTASLQGELDGATLAAGVGAAP